MDKKIIQKAGKYFTETEKHQIIQEMLSNQCTKQEIWQKYTGQEEEHGQLLRWMTALGYNIGIKTRRPNIDTERIFNYRALAIARKDTVSLPGFDENLYADNSNANNRAWQDMVAEFLAVRSSTEFLYKSFTEEALAASGISNNNPVTVTSLGFITLGHFYHHKNVIEERYL